MHVSFEKKIYLFISEFFSKFQTIGWNAFIFLFFTYSLYCGVTRCKRTHVFRSFLLVLMGHKWSLKSVENLVTLFF